MGNKVLRKATFSVAYEFTEDTLVDVLANGLTRGYCAFDEVDFDQDAYNTAKIQLLKERDERPTIEEVEARMIMNGSWLRLHTLEGGSKEWNDLTAESFAKGLALYAKDPINGTIDDVLKGDPEARLDANDYDAILQYAVFGEIIIG